MEVLITNKPTKGTLNMIFKDLTPKEKTEFQQHARNNYQPGQKIEYEIWHPVYCAECEAINIESEVTK